MSIPLLFFAGILCCFFIFLFLSIMINNLEKNTVAVVNWTIHANPLKSTIEFTSQWYQIPAKYIAYSHTVCAYSKSYLVTLDIHVEFMIQNLIGAFFVALIVGCYTHYYKIVQNEYFGYPQVHCKTHTHIHKITHELEMNNWNVLNKRNGFPVSVQQQAIDTLHALFFKYWLHWLQDLDLLWLGCGITTLQSPCVQVHWDLESSCWQWVSFVQCPVVVGSTSHQQTIIWHTMSPWWFISCVRYHGNWVCCIRLPMPI